MNSGDINEHDTGTDCAAIINYYKNFSQDTGLNKYFSMDPSLQHELKQAQNIDTTKLEQDNVVLEISKDDRGYEPCIVSPTSSITSNRKLEWDNGADIGYSNYERDKNLHKSLSLPTLSSLELETLEEVKKKTSEANVTRVNNQQKDTGSSTSNSNFSPNVFDLNDDTRIGIPGATSTPTTKSSSEDSEEKKTTVKEIKLSLTKPITIDCYGRPSISNKKLQTEPLEIIVKSVQTGDSLNKKTESQNVSKLVQTGDSLKRNTQESSSKKMAVPNQSVDIVQYESEPAVSNDTPQSDTSNILSKCNSFEYLYGDNYDNLKNKRPEIAENNESSEISSKIFLSEIENNQSKTLIGDVNKSIEILQKLLKSKKYDAATKRRYVKKIVQKLVDSQYVDDSSASSELFLPKKNVKNDKSSSRQQKLEENIPWYPAHLPQSQKLSMKVFSNEYLPLIQNNEQNISNQVPQEKRKKKSVFTIADDFKKMSESTDSSSNSSKHWKHSKTASELLLEQRSDFIAKHTSANRKNFQIQLINDEIIHLGKLKRMLEKSSKHRSIDSRKTTTVYMVSESKSSSSGKSSTQSSKKYVIHTDLEASSVNSDNLINFENQQDGAKTYRVNEMGRVKLCGEPNIITDVKVNSSDDTTNIYVKTRKSKNVKNNDPCIKREPILKGCGVYKSSTYPRSQQEIRLKPNSAGNGCVLELPINKKCCPKSGKQCCQVKCQCESTHCSCSSKSTQCSCNNIKCTDCSPKTCCCQRHKCKKCYSCSKKSCSESCDSNSKEISIVLQQQPEEPCKTVESCVCCKRRVSDLYKLKQQLSENSFNFCRPCYYYTQNYPWSPRSFQRPNHVCNCYSIVNTKILKEIKDTICELNCLENCCCQNGSRTQCCNTKIGSQGVSYVLKFDSPPSTRCCEKKCYTMKIPVEKVSNKGCEPCKPRPKTACYNLQEYLQKNYSNFIQRAEKRRELVLNSISNRRETENTKILLLQNNQNKTVPKPPPPPKRIYTTKELIEGSRKKYKKLPEVQKELNNRRNKELRDANRLIVNIFNKKLKENVLRGKLNFRYDIPVVSL